MHRSLLLGVVALTVLVLPAGDVLAGPTQVAVVGVEIGGDGAPELQAQLAESLVKGLEAANVKSIELADVRDALAKTPELIGCLSSTCLARIGEKLGVDGFARARVEADGADYTVELELYNTTELIHRVVKTCNVCTIGELNTLTMTSAKLLVEGASDSPVQVIIRTEPSGSELTIDGIRHGPAPFEGPLSPGPHLVVARSPSGKLLRQRLEVTRESAAEPMVIRIEEVLAAPVPTPRRDTGSGFGPWKWVAAGGAVGAVALGVTLVVIDGRGTCNTPGRECPRVRDTMTGGLVSLGAAVALTGAAGYMFWSDSRSPTPTLEVGSDGAKVGVRMRF